MAGESVEALVGQSLDDIIAKSKDSEHPKGAGRRDYQQQGWGRGRGSTGGHGYDGWRGGHMGGRGRRGRWNGGSMHPGGWAGMGDVGMMSGAPEGGFMGSPGPSQAFFEQHGPGWGQGRHGRGRGRGMRGGYGGPGMRGKSLRQHMLAQVDRSGFGRDDDEKRVVKALKAIEVTNDAGEKTGEVQVWYKYGATQEERVMVASISEAGEVKLFTGEDYSPEMLTALNLVLKPIGGKITEMEGEIWMVTLNNKMRQFSEGISLPPAANSRSRAKVVFRSILDPLAAAAQAAAQQAATMAARGGKSGSGGKSGPSDEQRRLMAQGRYAPY